MNASRNHFTAKGEAQPGWRTIKSRSGKTSVASNDFRLTEEIGYIRESRRRTRRLACGRRPQVLFSAETGDAWLLEPSDNLAACLAVARRMNPEFLREAGGSAGREVLRPMAEYSRRIESFAIGTTLAGSGTSTLTRTALERSFFARLFLFAWITPE